MGIKHRLDIIPSGSNHMIESVPEGIIMWTYSNGKYSKMLEQCRSDVNFRADRHRDQSVFRFKVGSIISRRAIKNSHVHATIQNSINYWAVPIHTERSNLCRVLYDVFL